MGAPEILFIIIIIIKLCIFSFVESENTVRLLSSPVISRNDLLAHVLLIGAMLLFFLRQSLWFYTLMNDKDGGFLYPTQQDSGFSKDWDIVRWVIAALPLIGVPIGALHACYSACGSGSPVGGLESVCVLGGRGVCVVGRGWGGFIGADVFLWGGSVMHQSV